MSNAAPKTRVLTVEQRDRRVTNGMCPCCGTVLTKRQRWGGLNEESGERKSLGSFYACERYRHGCEYYLGPGDERNPPRERTVAPPPQEPTGRTNSGVVRRTKNGLVYL